MDAARAAVCSRQHSRDAANIITSVLQPRMSKLGYQLPDQCPLDPDKGLYSQQESHKELVRRNVWRCKYDQKIFRGEAFIDKHMDVHHHHELDSNSPCLADLCAILHVRCALLCSHVHTCA
jgi:hypothetical protein